MKLMILTAATLALLGTAAFAQEDPGAPPPPPPAMDASGPDASAPPPPPPGMGPREMRHGPGGGPRFAPPPSPPSKAAHFRVDLGENRRLDVKCADDEPMKACADIANAMLDRIAPSRP